MFGFLDRAFIDSPCPRCGYAIEVQLIDVRLQSRVFCPCCKEAVQLIDAGASNEIAARQLDDALRRLGFDP